MPDKLNKTMNPTWKNIILIILPIVFTNLLLFGGVMVRDHYEQIGLNATMNKKADAQDLAEYIKLSQQQFDLTCKINNNNTIDLQRQLNSVVRRMEILEERIFEQQRTRSDKKETSYFLKHGLTFMMDNGIFPGDYCIPLIITQ